MRATRQYDTACEMALRSRLHRKGLRYRLHKHVIPGTRRTVDIAFPKEKIAVFVDGCFWHGCPLHGTTPKTNTKWWREKIETNRQRDLDTNQKLHTIGWHVIRIWEHESPIKAAERIMRAVLKARRIYGSK